MSTVGIAQPDAATGAVEPAAVVAAGSSSGTRAGTWS